MENEQQTTTEEAKSKVTKEMFAALKESILEIAPRVKGKDGKIVADPKFVETVNALKVSDCEIVASKDDTYVLHAGKFGVRKVTL